MNKIGPGAQRDGNRVEICRKGKINTGVHSLKRYTKVFHITVYLIDAEKREELDGDGRGMGGGRGVSNYSGSSLGGKR